MIIKLCVYSDHFGMVPKFKGLPTKLKMKKPMKNVKWNLNRKDGWINYRKLTTPDSTLESLAHESTDDSDMLVKKSEIIESLQRSENRRLSQGRQRTEKVGTIKNKNFCR